jgi:hypothetical protein
MLYYVSGKGDYTTLRGYQAPIIPSYDFNTDGKVDETDLLILQEHWGQPYPLCDIGPAAWGDGVVDAHDFMALMKYDTLQVPCDLTLHWPAGDLAQAYDVYLGSSFDDVSAADRDHPLDALVSQGQTATTFDLEGLLEFGRTYYWRVDEVTGVSSTSVSKGEVLSFVTETYYSTVQDIQATASSSYSEIVGPDRTIDG